MKSIQLSGVIIAKNAEYILKDCIHSLSFCDEIIVVDANSTDKTRETAKAFGALVVNGVENNFSLQRDIGAHHAKGNWILYVDADERVDEGLKNNILHIVGGQNDENLAAFTVKRKNFYLGKHIWPTIEVLERLFLREKLEGWYGKLHETARVNGQIGILEGFLLHYTHQTLTGMLSKTIEWSQVEAQLRYTNNHPKIVIWRLIRVMITGFWNSYIAQRGWKAGTAGFVESMYQAYSMFITYATLWEMQKNNKHE